MQVAVALVFLLPLCAQSGLPPEILLLSRIRHHAVSDLAKIPDFTCLETVERSSRNSPVKPFAVTDVVRVEVADVGKHELFAWPGASNFEERSLGEMVGSGMTSSGEFRSHASTVFEGDAVIHYLDEEELGGHRAARYDYAISPGFSGYTLNVNGHSAIVGTRGSFWADSSTFDLLRLTVEATDIPDNLGVRAVLTDIVYGRLHIGPGDFLLPQSAEIWMGHDSGLENRNRVDFTHCHQYRTESVVSFTEPPPGGPETVRPSTEFTIPPGLAVTLRLETPVVVSNARLGDLISASLASDLKHSGQIIAPRGSIVSGRIRLFELDGNRHVAGFEFTDLVLPGAHARFIAKLVSLDPRYTQPWVTSTQLTGRAHIAGRVETRSVQTVLPPQLPGVATFFIPAGVAQLPQGMLMEWKTVGLGK